MTVLDGDSTVYHSKLEAALAYDDAVLAQRGELDAARSIADDGVVANGALRRVHRLQKLNFASISVRARAVNAVCNIQQLRQAKTVLASQGPHPSELGAKSGEKDAPSSAQ